MSNASAPSLVPAYLTIGLGVFAVILSLAGFVFLPAEARPVSTIAIVFAVYVIALPAAFLLGGWLMRYVTGDQVHWRNALSLGFLVSCVAMLWKMGTGA